MCHRAINDTAFGMEYGAEQKAQGKALVDREAADLKSVSKLQSLRYHPRAQQ